MTLSGTHCNILVVNETGIKNQSFYFIQGAILLYDITSRKSFINILNWMDSIREHGSPIIKIALVGHKIDLEDDRQVTTEEGQKVNTVGSTYCHTCGAHKFVWDWYEKW